MKKFLVIALSALMITTVVGCSSKDGEIKSEAGNGVEENVEYDKMKHFGKVKNVVGNEMELEIANMDVLGMPEGGEEPAEGESTPAATMTEPMPAGSEEAVSGDANKEKMDMEYTGEVENITIPGGVTIMDLRTGKEGKISDIKDGTVIFVYTKSESISKIEILE